MHNAASTILVTENRLTIYSVGQREERRISSLLVGDECKQQVGGVDESSITSSDDCPHPLDSTVYVS